MILLIYEMPDDDEHPQRGERHAESESGPDGLEAPGREPPHGETQQAAAVPN